MFFFITLRKGSRQLSLSQRSSHSKYRQSLQLQNPTSSGETKTTSFLADWSGTSSSLYTDSAVLRNTSLNVARFCKRRLIAFGEGCGHLDSAIKLHYGKDEAQIFIPFYLNPQPRRYQMPTCIPPNFGVLDCCHLWICWELALGPPSNIFTAAHMIMPIMLAVLNLSPQEATRIVFPCVHGAYGYTLLHDQTFNFL